MLDISGDRFAIEKAEYEKAGPEPSHSATGYVGANGPWITALRNTPLSHPGQRVKRREPGRKSIVSFPELRRAAFRERLDAFL